MQKAAPREHVPPATADALIAEAREHARRRRRRAALAVVIVAAAVGGGLALTGAFAGGPTTAGSPPPRPAPVAARTGEVTGYLEPCIGVLLPGRPYPAYAAGTVTALPGRPTYKYSGDLYQLQLPAAAPVAREHVATDQAFALRLDPGQYTLVARYDGSSVVHVIDVTVRVGQVARQSFPDDCK